ncbi:hypothetical protein KUCAC02_021253, partial [Chaenocephalus aceratus]
TWWQRIAKTGGMAFSKQPVWCVSRTCPHFKDPRDSGGCARRRRDAPSSHR